jgi:DNA-binding response OmpR family regulator
MTTAADPAPDAGPAQAQAHTPDAPPRQPRILLRGADAALAALLAEWLGDIAELQFDMQPLHDDRASVDLHIVDVPFPRRSDAPHGPLPAHGRGVPVLMLSSTFLGAIDCHGSLAAALGVDGVLPKPVARDALLAAVRRLLTRTATPSGKAPP